jgi:hypothetical protein
MRTRHRHFQYKSAGASVALDSRSIHGVSDGTTVQTWNDLSGNSRDATQSTSTQRPTYKTAIQGGNGILRFDAVDGFLASDLMNAPYVTGTSYSLYCVYKRSGSPSNAFNNFAAVVSTGIAGNSSANARRFYLGYDDSSGAIFENASNGSGASMTHARNDAWNIHSVTAPIGSGTGRYLLNEGNEQTASMSTLGGVTSGTLRLTVASTSWDNASIAAARADIGLVVVYEEAHAAPLRRRLTHHAAFAFKISCN